MKNIERDRKRAWKEEQRALARKDFPLANDMLEELFEAVDSSLERNGCDHTLRLTRAWLVERGQPPEAMIAWLAKHGGHCDCEVIANALDYWEQNR